MIDYLTGQDMPKVGSHPVDAWRHAIMSFLIDHREQVLPLLQCPAKSMSPTACFVCPDSQVMSCVVQNPRDEADIAARRPEPQVEGKNEMSDGKPTADAADIQNAPRDSESLKAMNTWKLRHLVLRLSQVVDKDGQHLIPQHVQNAAVATALNTGNVEELWPLAYNALVKYDAMHGTPRQEHQPIMASNPTPPSSPPPASVGASSPPRMGVPPTRSTPPGGGATPPMRTGAPPQGRSIPTPQTQVRMPMGPPPQAAAGARPAPPPSTPPRTPPTVASVTHSQASYPDPLGQIQQSIASLTETVQGNTAAINALATAVGRLVTKAEEEPGGAELQGAVGNVHQLLQELGPYVKAAFSDTRLVNSGLLETQRLQLALLTRLVWSSWGSPPEVFGSEVVQEAKTVMDHYLSPSPSNGIAPHDGDREEGEAEGKD